MTFSRWIDNLSRIIGFLYSNGDHLIENVFHSAFSENFQSKCSPKSTILKRDLSLFLLVLWRQVARIKLDRLASHGKNGSTRQLPASTATHRCVELLRQIAIERPSPEVIRTSLGVTDILVINSDPRNLTVPSRKMKRETENLHTYQQTNIHTV